MLEAHGRRGHQSQERRAQRTRQPHRRVRTPRAYAVPHGLEAASCATVACSRRTGGEATSLKRGVRSARGNHIGVCARPGRTPYRMGSRQPAAQQWHARGAREARPPVLRRTQEATTRWLCPVRRTAWARGARTGGNAADVRVSTPPPKRVRQPTNGESDGTPAQAAGTFVNSRPRRAVGFVFVRRQRAFCFGRGF